MARKNRKTLHNIYRLFTSDLTRSEIERLIRVDTRDMYAYYARAMQQPDAGEGAVSRFFKFMRNFFTTFLLKLSPARRFLYGVGAVFLILSLVNASLAYAVYAFLIVNFLIALEVADKLIAKDELAVAREIQLSLLPAVDLAVPGYQIAAFTDVARHVGGDYYDVIPLADGSTLMVIADVTGKGISAALYMVKLQTLLRLFARELAQPAELMARIDRQLGREMKRNYFLTMSILHCNPQGRMTFCRAGHTPALHYHSQHRTCDWLEPAGVAIGFAGGVYATPEGTPGGTEPAAGEADGKSFAQRLQCLEARLAPGDLICLFTDGLTETFNLAQQEFGEQRLLAFLSQAGEKPLPELKQNLLQELADFRAGAELHDDLTFLLIRFAPQPKPLTTTQAAAAPA